MFLSRKCIMRSGFGAGAMLLFACPLLSSSATANQIVNGDFSSGDVGFTTGYNLIPANGTGVTAPDDVALTTNPALGFTNPFASYTDHTGNAGGLMLLVDGYYPGTNVWAEIVPVAPSTTYTFTGWVASAYPSNPAVLGLFSNGNQVGSSFVAPSSAGIWTQWATTLKTGPTASTVDLSIQDLNPNPYIPADDFSLDDLSLSGSAPPTTTPEPSGLGTCALVLIGGIVTGWRRFGLLQRTNR